ncbi:MAG: hypothetical protein KGD60_06755 [Candidatus Thorarchaeota archaeon]|nr:hypothetical protein [Candidatus Thorarchaeota archaeon]
MEVSEVGIDLESTQEKEVRIQAELYRILRNHVCTGVGLLDGALMSWKPYDVLIEASIPEPGNKIGRADLVLLGQRELRYKVEIKPLLVIEVKRRKTSQLTKHYKAYIRQARRYAYALQCPIYTVYDGFTWILMQISSPFLIGLRQWSFSSNERRNQEFAREIWEMASEINERKTEGPVRKFVFHSDFLPWKESIYYFIKDAFQFKIEVDQKMSLDLFDIDGEAKRFANVWRELHSRS